MMGWETANNGEAVGAPGAGLSIVTTPLPTGGGGRVLKNDGTSTAAQTIYNNLDGSPALPSTGFYCTFRFRIDATGAPSTQRLSQFIIIYDTAGTFQGLLQIQHWTDNNFYVWWSNGSTEWQFGNVSGQVSANTWVSCRAFISPTRVKVWLNGTLYDTGALADAYTTTAVDQTRSLVVSSIGGSTSDTTHPFYMDDLCLWDSDPGCVPFVIARQFSANSSTNNGWTAVGGANKFSNVSETPVGTTNAISSASANNIQLFVPNTFSSTETGKGSGVITAGTHVILGARISAVGKTSATSSSGNLIKLRWKNSSAATTDWSFTTLTTTDSWLDLNTGSGKVNGQGLFYPSSVADLNGSEFGVSSDLGTRTKTVEDIWVNVAFAPGRWLPAAAGSYSMSGVAATTRIRLTEAADPGSYAMTGSAANVTKSASPKSVVAGLGSYSITGQAAGVKDNKTVIAAAGTYTITGQAALVKVGKKVLAAASSYAITGQAAGVKKNDAVVAASGSYSMSGTAAGVAHGWKIAAGVGSYSITGQPASPRRGRTLTAGAGSYSMSGTAAGVLHAWKVAAAPGSYAMTGTDATLAKQAPKSVAADPGSYSISGQIAIVRKAYTEAAGAGSYAVTGQAAGVKLGRKVAAAAGSYQLTGTSAGVRRAFKALANAGTYQITGQAAGVLKTRAVVGGTSSYTLSGQPALTIRSRKFAADPGGYLISGTDATLFHDQIIPEEPHYGGTGVGGGYWKRVPDHFEAQRRAREEAAAAFRRVAATKVAQRKEAAQRASDALAAMAVTLPPADPQIDILHQLQAYLEGLIEQERIRAEEAREAARMWAMIEREMARKQEEELMVVLSLAL